MPYTDHDHSKEHTAIDPVIISGGIILTFIAGFINTISLNHFHVPISHMSGVVTKLSIDLASGDLNDFTNLILILTGFFSGSIISGFVIGARNIKPSREYVFILGLESVLLFGSFFLFQMQSNIGLVMVSLSCGLQNSMASNYLGLIIRTTHVTGVVTDLGVLIGQTIKHKKIKTWKILFLTSLISGFFMGGFMALNAFFYIGFYALFIPASLCLISAIFFFFFRVIKAHPGY
jgi:uncharacterized membrane protein YoaK (UPF0700 family)